MAGTNINADPLIYGSSSVTATNPPTRTISDGSAQYTAQTIVYPATAIAVGDATRFEVGFKARRVRVTNLTSTAKLVIVEWNSSLPANVFIKKVTAGTTTKDTTADAFVINARTVDVLQTVALGLIEASGTTLFEAWG